MDLLVQDFNTISFQDVVDFCDQKVVENTELDYKQIIPRDLTKHFSAMSNRYGGLVIVGVEEDPQTGTPNRYEGIVNDGKLIDRIHQFANNVRPLPTYHVRTTDEVNGKVFLLVRISEGGAPPYTSVNDRVRLYGRCVISGCFGHAARLSSSTVAGS
jgi:predicted HTH transcriptional regulator